MRVLVQLSHPAHFHLYKIVMRNLVADGHEVHILIKTKDVLEDLLKESGLPYCNILPVPHRKTKLGVLMDMLHRECKMISYCRRNKIDILTGSTPEVAHVGFLLGLPRINTGEDDAAVVPLFGKLAGPFLKVMLTPDCCNNGSYESKVVKYASYHELAYLHPNHFTPDRAVVEKYFDSQSPFFLLRFASLTAHHDSGIRGINTDVAQHLIDILEPYGRIFITSERPLEPQFEKYRIHINPIDIHHVMAFASLYVGDSQTMAAEAAVLGVPFVRFNDFVGRIGYLDELENRYGLGRGVLPSDVQKLYSTVRGMLTDEVRAECATRRAEMLEDKVDFARFLTWFIETYPESEKQMRLDSNIQYEFR